MKRAIPLLFVFILLLGGCTASSKTLGDGSWKFIRISESESGKIVYCNEKESTKFTDAKVADLSCTTTDTQIIIQDTATENEWILDYSLSETVRPQNSEGNAYDIVYTDGETSVKGYLTSGISNSDQTDEIDYFYIVIDGYELYFNNI